METQRGGRRFFGSVIIGPAYARNPGTARARAGALHGGGRGGLPAEVPVLGALADVPWIIDRYGVDEVMVHPVAGALRGTPSDRSVAREETLRLLADALS